MGEINYEKFIIILKACAKPANMEYALQDQNNKPASQKIRIKLAVKNKIKMRTPNKNEKHI